MQAVMSMSPGKQYSLLLHLALLFFMIFGLPDFLHKRPDSEPMAISVDILPIAPISNVKPQEKSEPVEQKKPVAEKKTERKATAETKKEEAKPQEKPILIKAKDVVKMPDKKPEKKKVEKKQDDLESILKSVKDTAKTEESKHPTEKAVTPNVNKAQSQTYDASMPLSLSEKDAIRNQFQRCWNVPAGAKDAANLVVTLHVTLTADGMTTSVELASDKGRYGSDTFFRAAADSAMRAVRECSPLKNLPADKYGSWRDMELTFDPKDML